MAATASAATRQPASTGGASVTFVLNHPCVLLTQGQADAAAHAKFGPAQQIPRILCEYTSHSSLNATINVYMEVGTVKENLPPKDLGNTYIAEPTIGRGAIWVVEKGSPKGSGELFFWLGYSGKTAFSIQVELDQGGLKEALTVAKDCIGHLS
jgi:hypothetical protein